MAHTPKSEKVPDSPLRQHQLDIMTDLAFWLPSEETQADVYLLGLVAEFIADRGLVDECSEYIRRRVEEEQEIEDEANANESD